jgi:hypothetical protein
MTQEERIIKKVYDAKKVELGTHKVELGLVQDIESSIADKEGMPEYEQIMKKRSELASLLSASRDAFFRKIDRTEKLVAQLDAQYKELGLPGKNATSENAKKMLLGEKERIKKIDKFSNAFKNAVL